jgi:hypothetical protein
MWANKVGLLTNADLFFYRSQPASSARFSQSNSADIDQAEIYSMRIRALTIVGLSLGLWLSIALLASAMI